jgi:hypothetical protein
MLTGPAPLGGGKKSCPFDTQPVPLSGAKLGTLRSSAAEVGHGAAEAQTLSAKEQAAMRLRAILVDELLAIVPPLSCTRHCFRIKLRPAANSVNERLLHWGNLIQQWSADSQMNCM